MPSLEYAVRPYQSPNNRNSLLIPSAPSLNQDLATISWGAEATLPPVNQGIGFQVVCCKEQLDEKDRDSSTVQIPIQEDANYVEVSRPNSLSLQKHENNNCGDDWDQFSGVGAEITSALNEFAADVHSGTVAKTGNCDVKWKFNN
jgi:hypothetical protein